MTQPEQNASRFVTKLREISGVDNIVCILLFGSALHNNNPRDIDIFVLFKKYQETDLKHLRDAMSGFDIIDLHIQWESLLHKLPELRFGNQGAYFQQILARAKVLWGENVYKHSRARFSEFDKVDLRKKITEYFFRLDRMYVIHNSTKNEVMYLQKYVARICLDLLLLSGELQAHKLQMYSLEQIILLVTRSKMSSRLSIDLNIFFDRPSWESYPKVRGVLYQYFSMVAFAHTNFV